MIDLQINIKNERALGFALALLLLLLASACAQAQSSGLPLQSPAYHLLDRLDILSSGKTMLHPELKSYARQDAAAIAVGLDSLDLPWTKRDRRDFQYLANENDEWVGDSCALLKRNKRRLLKYFCATPGSFFSVNTPDFTLRVNPMANFSLGRQQGDSAALFANQRGLEVHGTVDRKLYFYTNLVESQLRLPAYMEQWVKDYHSVPGVGFYKDITSGLYHHKAFDFNTATAYVGFHISRHVDVQLGHGKHFLGNGLRSVFLSDVGNYTFFLKLNTRVWRFQYQNLFLELSPISQTDVPDGIRLPKKYVAVHYLNYRVTPRFALGLFEATVFNRSRQFELQYLNPVILYRTVEGMIGSPDNVLIGLDGRLNLGRHVQLYGQLLLDEFVYSALVDPDQKGWWGNKYAVQAGGKYVNAFGIDHLDVQAEVNLVRPYTYSHNDSLDSYTHYSQPLAHPLWANFAEFYGKIWYQPLPQLTINVTGMAARKGDNGPGQNWGANPLLSYDSRVMDYGNTLGQGVGSNIRLFRLDVSWMLYHNLFVDMNVLLRRKTSDDPAADLYTQTYGIGLRMNIWERQADF